MNRVSWGAAIAAGLVVGVPMAVEAATPPSSTPRTPSAPATAPASNLLPTPTAPVAPAKSSQPQQSTTTSTRTAQSSTGSTATHASDTTSTPAPPGSAEAYAARVDDIVAVSHTKASASGSGTSSTADPLELGGTNPPASQFGGTQTGAGSSKGALLDTGPSSQFRLALTPWQATNTESASGNTASGLADVVLLDIGDPTTAQSAYVRVLQSQSNATWTPTQSTGSSSSDGAIVNLGGPSGLTLDVLHSQADSSGTGSSYLISVNGNQIGSSGQVNGQCVINVPPLLALSCLTASGGTAGSVTSAASNVLTFTLGSGAQSLTGGAIQSSSSSGHAAALPSTGGPPASTSPASSAPTAKPAAAPPAAAPAAAAAVPANTSHALAFTGIDLAGWLGGALALTGTGGTIVWFARRRTPRRNANPAA